MNLLLVRNLLSFVTYRAVGPLNAPIELSDDDEVEDADKSGPSSAVIELSDDDEVESNSNRHKFKRPILAAGREVGGRTVNILKGDVEWLNDDEVHQGILRAISDASNKKGIPSNLVHYADSLKHAGPHWEGGNRSNDGRVRKITPDTQYIIWFVNTTPFDRAPGALNSSSSGNHWCVILVDIGCSLSEIHERALNYLLTTKDLPYKIPVTIHFFNPMGGSIPGEIQTAVQDSFNRTFLQALVRDGAEAYDNILRVVEDNDDDNRNIYSVDYTFKDVGRGVQQDGVQCGVYCIWMVHQFLLTREMNPTQWQDPGPQDKIHLQFGFRKWYFAAEAKNEAKQPTGPSQVAKADKGKAPMKDDNTEVIDLIGDTGSRKKSRYRALNRPTQKKAIRAETCADRNH